VDAVCKNEEDKENHLESSEGGVSRDNYRGRRTWGEDGVDQVGEESRHDGDEQGVLGIGSLSLCIRGFRE